MLWGGQDAAKAAGHRDVVVWLYRHVEVTERNDEATLKAAVASGGVELLRWPKERTDIRDVPGIQDAAANGHLKMVEWLYSRPFKTAGTLLRAAENEHLNIVR